MSQGNDISQVNESGSGFASGATNPEIYGTREPVSNLGMTGPNKTRFNPFGTIATTQSKLVLPGNKWRNYLMVQNNSANEIYIGFGQQVAADFSNGFFISGNGGFYEMDNRVPFNSIYILGVVAAGQQVLIVEGVIDKTEQ
jgi:hypothetical protein